MTTRDTAASRVATSPKPVSTDERDRRDPLDRLAVMFADLSTELDRVSEELRQRPEPEGSSDRHRPGAPPPTGPATLRGEPEPVDTSFAPNDTTATAESTQGSPATSVAGDSPSPARESVHGDPTPTPSASTPPAPVASRPYPTPPPREEAPSRLSQWASREGVATRLPAWAGGAVTLLGVVLLLVMAVQQGWVGPLARVLGGAGLGTVLLACAGWVHRRSGRHGRAGAFSLAATGIATLYLDVLAATALYSYLPVPVGLTIGLALAGLGLWLADRWSSQALAIGVVLGCASCAPLLFGSALADVESAPALLTGFLVLLKIAAAPVQLRRAWPGLTAVSALPAIVAALVANVHAVSAESAWPAVPAGLAVAVTGVALAVVTARRRPKDPVSVGLLVLAGTPALLVAPMLDRGAELAVVLGVGALYAAVWLAGMRLARMHVPAIVGRAAGGMLAVAVFQASVSALDGSARSLALLGEAVVLAALAIRLRGKGMLLVATLYAAAGTLVAVVADVPATLFLRFPSEPYVLDDAVQFATMLSGLVTFAALAFASVLLPWAAVRLGVLGAPGAEPRDTEGEPQTEHRLLTVAAPVLPLLYGAGGLVLTAVLLLAPSPTGFLVGHALITVSWIVAAFVLLSYGLHHLAPRVAGFTLITAGLAKLLLFDLAALDGFARVGAFLGAGLVLLAGGTRYAKRIAENDEPHHAQT